MTAYRMRIFGAGAGGMVAIALLAGCGSSASKGSTVAPSVPAPAPATSAVPPTTAATAVPSATSTTVAPRHSAAEAVAFVRGIYDRYVGPAAAADPAGLLGTCFGPAGGVCSLNPDAYVTPALGAELKQYARTYQSDPVVCAQNVPARVSYGSPRLSDSSATIEVHTYYLESAGAAIAVKVDLNSLKLTGLSCQVPSG